MPSSRGTAFLALIVTLAACGGRARSSATTSREGGAHDASTDAADTGTDAADTGTDVADTGTDAPVDAPADQSEASLDGCPTGAVFDGGACACPAGRVDCGGICTDLSQDDCNCGACGQHCAGGLCMSGACQCLGNQLPLQCGGSTVCSYSGDPRNCGGCGVTCPANTTCSSNPDGSESCAPCAAPLEACGSGQCVDLSGDQSNCGACGCQCKRLDGSFVGCSGGACDCGSLTNCCATGGSGCVDLQSDPENCGACGHACPTSDVCVSGTCTPCPAGKIACRFIDPSGALEPTTCVDPMSDPENCGQCNHRCFGPWTCSAGTCVCNPGNLDCPGTVHDEPAGVSGCTDPTYDKHNCGACGHDCGPAGTCVAGVCQCHGWMCGGLCVDVMHDAQNCGRCGHACANNEQCACGTCAPKG